MQYLQGGFFLSAVLSDAMTPLCSSSTSSPCSSDGVVVVGVVVVGGGGSSDREERREERGVFKVPSRHIAVAAIQVFRSSGSKEGLSSSRIGRPALGSLALLSARTTLY